LIESSPGFSTQIACPNIFLQERAGPIFWVSKTLIEHLHDGQTGIEADEVC
jgi:hypothetical protein